MARAAQAVTLTHVHGLAYSADGGKSWKKLGLEGESDFHALAASYRTNAVYVLNTGASVVAAGTSGGLYLSRDSANQFDRIVGGQQVLAQAFDLDGQHLWFSGHAGQPSLMRIALEPGAQPEPVTLPPLTDDAVAYIAQNPARRGEIAIATFNRSVFVSKDTGRSWTGIALGGATRNSEAR